MKIAKNEHLWIFAHYYSTMMLDLLCIAWILHMYCIATYHRYLPVVRYLCHSFSGHSTPSTNGSNLSGLINSKLPEELVNGSCPLTLYRSKSTGICTTVVLRIEKMLMTPTGGEVVHHTSCFGLLGADC